MYSRIVPIWREKREKEGKKEGEEDVRLFICAAGQVSSSI